MKTFLLALFSAFLCLTMVVPDAEAKRLGGGRNAGMQREPVKKQQQDVQPATPASPQQGAAPQTPGKRSWMGPIAGLAAGLGLAALASHFGFGEEMANFLMLALLGLGAFMLIGWLMRRKATATQPMQYAGAGMAGQQPVRFEAPVAAGGSAAVAAAGFPPGFDAQGFARQAKVNFLRLQAAHDAGNLDDIREFTTPEMYAEIKLDIDERKGTGQRTEVTLLEAEVLEAVEEGNRHIASVRFHGLLKEDSETAQPFDETWHLTRAADGKGGWVVAGIQQNG
ncbi:MAG: TIM44-like domain-containing protein [Pseudomonadota bacterium]